MRPMLIRSRVGAPAGLVFLAAVFAGCSGDECASPADCLSSQICVSGACEDKGGGPINRPPVDAGPARDVGFADALPVLPDSGVIDSGASDTGTGTVAADGGMNDGGGAGDGGPTDAGVTDTGAPPLPRPDAGANFDGGGTQMTLSNTGEVVIGDIAGGGRFLAEGRFIRNTGATHSVVTQFFDLGPEGSCALDSEQLVGGMVEGISANRIEITFDSSPHNASGATLMPVGGGRFETMQQLQPPLFLDNGGGVEFEIFAGSNSRDLDNARAGVAQPPNLRLTSPANPGTVYAILGGPSLGWTPHRIQVPQRLVKVEIYDFDRRVRLVCDTPDDGAFEIPMDARLAWLLQSPVAPATMDVTYNEAVTQSVPLVGGGTAETVFRAARGSRYPVQ